MKKFSAHDSKHTYIAKLILHLSCKNRSSQKGTAINHLCHAQKVPPPQPDFLHIILPCMVPQMSEMVEGWDCQCTEMDSPGGPFCAYIYMDYPGGLTFASHNIPFLPQAFIH